MDISNNPIKSLSVLLGCLTVSALSHSQTSDGEEAANNQRDQAMEEIVVTSRYTTNDRLDTATGLGLTLYETPQSVSVMTAQRIADQNLSSLTDVVLNAAGMSAKAQDSSRHVYSARGFDLNNYQLDGVPIYWEPGGNAGETQSDMSLYERVEVVRGATGLLTGAGNPSASINLVRKHADSKVLTGTVDVSAGRWDTYRVTTDVSTPLTASGSIRGRFVANYQDGDSFRDLEGDRKTVFYAVVDADLTEQTLLRIGASRQDNEPTASTWGGLPVWFPDGSRTDWGRDKTIGTDWTSWSSVVENYYLDLVHEFGNGWNAKFSVNNSINSSDQKLLYIGYDSSGWLYASPRNAETESEQISFSLQVNGQYSLLGREHQLTVGVVDHEEDGESFSLARSNVADLGDFNNWDGSYPQPTWGAANLDIDQTTEQFGFYAATRLSLTEQFKVILGGRLADWSRQGQSYGTFHDFGDDDVLIPYAGALYEFNEQHTVYASYTEIFQPQNLQDASGDFLDPITGKSHELGLKSRFFNGALQTTLAVFNIQQDNLGQPDGSRIVPGTINSQAYYEADGTESEGYELEVVGELMPGWNVSFSYTHFEAEDANGLEVNTNHPRELLKLYSNYQFSGVLAGLTVAGGVNWQGRTYTDVTNPFTGQAERLKQDAYSLVSLMARYEISTNLTAQLNIDNLLDEEYYSQIGFYSQLEFGRPRNITASFKYEF